MAEEILVGSAIQNGRKAWQKRTAKERWPLEEQPKRKHRKE